MEHVYVIPAWPVLLLAAVELVRAVLAAVGLCLQHRVRQEEQARVQRQLAAIKGLGEEMQRELASQEAPARWQ